MTLEAAVREVRAALEAKDAVAAAAAMQDALLVLAQARRDGAAPSTELERLVAECQPLLQRLEDELNRQMTELGAGARAGRAYSR